MRAEEVALYLDEVSSAPRAPFGVETGERARQRGHRQAVKRGFGNDAPLLPRDLRNALSKAAAMKAETNRVPLYPA